MRKSYSLLEAYNYLKKYQLSDSLYLIGAINATLKYGVGHLEKENIPKEVLVWLGRMSNKNAIRLNIYLSSTRLARLLLLSGTNDYRGKPLSLLDNSLPKAIDVAGDMYDLELETELKNASSHFTNNILGRIGQLQFPLQDNRMTLIARAFLLFDMLPKQVKGNYSIDQKMKEHFDLGFLEFIATGLALWLKCDGTLDYNLEIITNDLKGFVNNKTQQAFLKLSSGTPEEYRRKIRGDYWKKPNKLYDIYFLEPFLQMPAIKVGSSAKLKKGTFVVPQPKYLLDRTSTGIFYLLADKEQKISRAAGNMKANPFRVYFGEVYRAYVKAQLEQANKETTVIDLDADFKNKSGEKLPDFAIIQENICILIEVKTSLLTLKSRAFFDEEIMLEEIKNGSFKKAVSQLNDFRVRILQKQFEDIRFDHVTTVINILAGYEDIFVLNSYLLPMLDNQYSTLTENLQLASISDIDALGSILHEGNRLGKLLVLKLNDEEQKSWMLAQFFIPHIKHENIVLKNSFDSFWKRINITF